MRTLYIWFLDYCKTRWRLQKTPCVHSGDFTGDSEFNSYVSCFLTLIKIISILFLHTHHLFLVGIIAHLVVSDLLIYSFSLREPTYTREILDLITEDTLYISLVCSTIYHVFA